MRVLTVANHKGGVGKTSTVRALGDSLAADGFHVLMIDSDHQGSLTLSCGIKDPDLCMANVYQVAGRRAKALDQVIKPIGERLDVAPSTLALAAAETELFSRSGREFILADALGGLPNRYDLTLIDCPPSLNTLVINALVAADSVLIPSLPQHLDVSGVRMFLENVDRIRANKRLNPSLTILGVLLTFYDSRLRTHQAAAQAMKRAGWPVLPVHVPRSIRVAEASAFGQSILTFEPGNPAAQAYRDLGKAVAIWLTKGEKQ